MLDQSGPAGLVSGNIFLFLYTVTPWNVIFCITVQIPNFFICIIIGKT